MKITYWNTEKNVLQRCGARTVSEPFSVKVKAPLSNSTCLFVSEGSFTFCSSSHASNLYSRRELNSNLFWHMHALSWWFSYIHFAQNPFQFISDYYSIYEHNTLRNTASLNNLQQTLHLNLDPSVKLHILVGAQVKLQVPFLSDTLTFISSYILSSTVSINMARHISFLPLLLLSFHLQF